ncbi:hypothetical protein HDU67_008762 [Dinochytrium kinnereticum]|nr:hypothetical protein HDU67_008762 [Dinochytrium kinnereticum]
MDKVSNFITQKLSGLSVGDYQLQPLDLVLFNGKDPVASFIRKVQRNQVVPHLDRPFHALWTHAGILVDKTILPLDCLEPNKLYLYESIFSGEVAGYVYSKVLPLDHAVKQGSFHLGPQVRDFAAVVEEADSDVAICPLSTTERKRIMKHLDEDPMAFMNLYEKYKTFGYPLAILPQLAAANDALFKQLDDVRSFMASTFNLQQKKAESKEVFCSELVAILYRAFSIDSFTKLDPGKFTPLEVEVAPEFEGKCYYVKENKKVLLKDSQKVPTECLTTRYHNMVRSFTNPEQWVKVTPGSPFPDNAEAAGQDIDGKPLYIARAKIGAAVHVGKTMVEPRVAFIPYDGNEMNIRYEHEVLVSLKNMAWVAAKDGEIPPNAIAAGFEEDGDTLHIARGEVSKGGFMNFGAKKSVVPGKISKDMGGANLPFNGKEVKVKNYEVLCYA